eukprot:gene18647-18943_t
MISTNWGVSTPNFPEIAEERKRKFVTFLNESVCAEFGAASYTEPSLFPEIEGADLSPLPRQARARGREADWQQQMARAYSYAAGRARGPEEREQIESAYETAISQGADFTRYRGKSGFIDAPRISIDRNAAARIKFMIACIQRGSWRVKDKGKHGGLIPRTVVPVFDALVRLAFKHGRVFPSLVGLAQLAMCCKQTVVQALKVLEFYGFIRVHRRVKRIRTPLGFKVVQDTNAYEITEPNGWGMAECAFGAPVLLSLCHPAYHEPQPVNRARARFSASLRPPRGGDFGFAFVIVRGYRDGEHRFALRARVRHACGASNREQSQANM